jgi:hypothetical protein
MQELDKSPERGLSIVEIISDPLFSGWIQGV